MKKLISLFAILTMFGGIAFAYDGDGNASNKREINGAQGYVAYREYQLVRYAENGPNGVQLSAGDVVVADCVSDDGITVAILGATNSVDAVKGVVVSPTIGTADSVGTTPGIDFGRRNWGYIQVKGLCTKVNVTGGPTTAGSTLVASGTYARYATKSSVTAFGQRALGFALDASEEGNASDVNIEV